MTTATSQRPASRPIKGSWEDLHSQAQQHARNYNDEAIVLYQRVFNGLMALPPAARAAGEQRLYSLMMMTGVELQGYLNVRDRSDEALDVIEKMLAVVEDDDKAQIIELKSDVLMQSEHGDEAIALLRRQLENSDAEASDWGKLVGALIRLKQPEKALPVIDEMDKWITAQREAGKMEAEELRETRYYQERLRAAALLELDQVDEAIALFNQLYSLDGASAFSPHLLYTRLIREGRYDEALRYIDRDQARPVRVGFWRGLVYKYMGEAGRATRTWEAALNEEIVRAETESIVEHILTLLYLGDSKREGLEIMLRTQREQRRLSWMIFLLTGLGWIVRGDFPAAHSNIKLAVSQVKSMGEGKTLTNQYWRFVQDLAPEGEAAQFAQYFDTEEASGSTANAAPESDAVEEPVSEPTPTGEDVSGTES